ncbi:hypothetical protein BWZ20_03280 [Winogradskyella sp. J14-2]|uniref:hypothetical protein n=1 Tax=Winogradskyella sp. J14-2 TaxID=1936080 RepID=UPI000972C5C3|nr:hypothetical protein [Winogradskyella sp. J14-2]APY07381.1 hypothetical protein BWZ20_03280 [Winogradskyella sp. J14-2]
MNTYLHNTIPNLIPFDYALHHDSHFINQQWVLVNGISKKKAIYTFRDDNILEIRRKDATVKTSWTISIQNIFTIETEDGIINVKAYFKDDDILVLNHQDKDEFAMYINTSNYSEELNSIEDIQEYLRIKYKKKVNKIIHKHKFYYISKSKEFGPCTVKELKVKVDNEDISAYCFVRDVNEESYAKRLRVIDLLQEL